MAKIDFKGNTQSQSGQGKKRWQKIMDAPDYARFQDISTGQIYTRGQFKPIPRHESPDDVYEFALVGTKETVFVDFLRLSSDTQRCSL